MALHLLVTSPQLVPRQRPASKNKTEGIRKGAFPNFRPQRCRKNDSTVHRIERSNQLIGATKCKNKKNDHYKKSKKNAALLPPRFSQKKSENPSGRRAV